MTMHFSNPQFTGLASGGLIFDFKVSVHCIWLRHLVFGITWSYVQTNGNYDNGNYDERTSTGSYGYTLEFKKNGIGKHKNKTQLVLNLTSAGHGQSFIQTYSGNYTSQTYEIKELCNKKIDLVSKNTQTTHNYVYFLQNEYTFEQ